MLGMHQPQLDVAEAAVPECLVGFLDGERQQVRGIADVPLGHVVGVDHHQIDRDVLGFERLAVRIEERRNFRLGRRRTRRRRLGGARRHVDVAHRGRRVVTRQLVAIHFRERVDPAAQILDGVDRSPIGEIARQQRAVPQHEHGALAGLLHLAAP